MRPWSPVIETIHPMGQSHFSAEGPAYQLSLFLIVMSQAENGCRFLRAMFSQNQSYNGQRTSKLSSWRNTLTTLPPRIIPVTPRQLQQHWRWTLHSRGKQGFLQILFYLLQSAVLSVLIQSAISLTIKPDVHRHGPSTETESMPFRKCRIKTKKSQESWDMLMFGPLRVS